MCVVYLFLTVEHCHFRARAGARAENGWRAWSVLIFTDTDNSIFRHAVRAQRSPKTDVRAGEATGQRINYCFE